MTLKQRIYEILLPLPREKSTPPPSTFSDAQRRKQLDEAKAQYRLNMEIERRRGMVGA